MEMKKYLIADTETSSLPISYTAPFTDVDNWPRIIQLAWELCWENGETIKKVSELIEPDGWRFPTDKFWVDNGFNEADSLLNGLPIKPLLTDLAHAMNCADILVCHNISFDKPIIEAEMYRYKVFPKSVRKELLPEWAPGLRPEGVNLLKECTKLLSTPILKLPGFGGSWAWPKLEVAYRYMFNKDFTDAHQADADVQATKEVYLWIKSMEDLM